jgi:hypothetical protein
LEFVAEYLDRRIGFHPIKPMVRLYRCGPRADQLDNKEIPVGPEPLGTVESVVDLAGLPDEPVHATTPPHLFTHFPNQGGFWVVSPFESTPREKMATSDTHDGDPSRSVGYYRIRPGSLL